MLMAEQTWSVPLLQSKNCSAVETQQTALPDVLPLAQVGITAAILAGCLGRYTPRQRGLFRVAWQGGRWLWVVAAGGRRQAACMALLAAAVTWLVHWDAAVRR